MMRRLATILCTLAATCALTVLHAPTVRAESAAAPAPGETQAEVPELDQFHEVIYQLWHDAWPKKDLDAMSALLPEIEKGTQTIEKAKLPGILRDKQPKWDENVRALRESVARYRKGVEAKDLQSVLDAGEEVHARFEGLVRTIHPPIPELEAFHQVLYRLYHYELPAEDLPKIRVTSGDLVKAMGPLNAATLPKRLQPKQQEFDKNRASLSRSVDALEKAASSSTDPKEVRAAVERVHDDYQALERIF